MKTIEGLLRALTLLPFGLLGAAACGGSASESAAGHGGAGAGASSAGSAAGGSAGLANVAGASSAGASSAGASSAGASSGGSSGAIGSGGSAGVDIRACTSSSECQVAPVSCCSCGMGPVSAFTSINSKYSMEYLACAAVDCAPCPPVAHQVDNPVSYYVPTCQAHECQVLDLRSEQTDITACKQDSDCTLRAGTGCCSGCGGGQTVAIGVGKEAALQKLVCGSEQVVCPDCAPNFAGYSAQCNAGRCRVHLACGAGQLCGD